MSKNRNRQRSLKKQKKEKERDKKVKNENKKNMRFDKKQLPIGFKKEIPDEKILIGVYGFLRKGMVNHEQLDDAECVGIYETEPSFTLYNIEGFPCLSEKGSHSVVIEVYNVERAIFQSLEWHNNLEGNTLDYTNNYEVYKLKYMNTPFGKAYMFLLDESIVNKKNGTIIEDGNWFDYCETRSNLSSKLLEMVNNINKN